MDHRDEECSRSRESSSLYYIDMHLIGVLSTKTVRDQKQV